MSWVKDTSTGIVMPISVAEDVTRRRIDMRLGGYTGASRTDRSMRGWNPLPGDADTDTLWDLPTLRSRSRDLERNAPLAKGAIDTTVINAVGSGLQHKCEVDRKALGWSDGQAEEWEGITEREFALWAESVECDTERTLDFYSRQPLAFFQVLLNGDYFELTPHFKRSGSPYLLKLQGIEADRCCNPGNARNTVTLSGGVEKDGFGAPIKYYFLNQHPGAFLTGAALERKWDAVSAFAPNTGLKNVLHLFEKKRPGQSRAVPMLAAVMRPLKQLDMYSDNELKAALISSLFTVFIKSPGADAAGNILGTANQTVPINKNGEKDYLLDGGAIIDLNVGEEIQIADPKRPNDKFDPFVQAIYRHVGIALNIPYEVLIKHFESSYSASMAAILEAWRFFRNRRLWFVRNYCKPVYEIWMYEAVALGRIKAPGFFDDPILHNAYLGASWIGPGRGHIRPDVEQKAAEGRVGMGLTTMEQETAEYDGSDFQKKIPTIKRERGQLKDAGLGDIVAPNGTVVSEQAPDTDPNKAD